MAWILHGGHRGCPGPGSRFGTRLEYTGMTNRNVEEHGIVRIAFITDCYWPRVNGVTVSVQTFKEELERRGHEVIVLCPEYPRRDRTLEEPGLIRFASAGSFASPEDRLVHVHEFPRIFHTLDRFRPDAVHVNTEFSLQLAARAWCKARGYPFVITAHTNWEEYVANYIPGVPRGPLKVLVRTIMRLIYGECDVLITPTAEMAAVLRGYHIRRKIRVVPTGIELSHFQATREEAAAWRARLDERHPSLAGKRLLLFVGRVTEEKNAAFLVPVLARVLRRVPDAALYYIGDGHGRAHIERLAAGAGLTDRAIVGGYLPRTELRFAYAAASIYTFPSKTETLGLSTIEAMCAGLPVVAIGEMGTRTVMRGDNGGFMVRDDQREFAEACIRLLLDPALHAAKSAEALAWSKQFSIDVQAERMERIYAFASTQRRSAMSTTQKIGLKARWMFKALERRVASIDR